jgi:WD40-like Beta Propeller Repeat
MEPTAGAWCTAAVARLIAPRILLALLLACTVPAAAAQTRQREGTARAGLEARIPHAPLASLRGRIAFSTRGGDIWVMNANGSGRRRITRSGRGVDFDPDFAPDGRRIVFRTSRGRYLPDRYGIGLEGIFVVDVRTRRERQIQPPTGGLFPAWSPDGALIAFSGLVADGRPVDTIQLMTPTGTDVVDLGAPGEGATWSPTGARSPSAPTRATATGRSGRCAATAAAAAS